MVDGTEKMVLRLLEATVRMHIEDLKIQMKQNLRDREYDRAKASASLIKAALNLAVMCGRECKSSA